MPKPIALVTGASAGIGRAIAKRLAHSGYDLVVTARRQEALDELAAELRHCAVVHPIACDLSKRRGPKQLFGDIQALGLQIDTLINNAGMAYQGNFKDISSNDLHDLLGLNIRALTELTYLFVPQMLEHKRGRILNIASVVSFQAIPQMALYSASKAYVLSLTESLAEELAGTGVKVSALCPGLTRTELATEIAGSQPGAEWLMSEVDDVAKAALCNLKSNDVIQIPGLLNQLAVNWAEYQPRWLKRTLAGIASRTMLQGS